MIDLAERNLRGWGFNMHHVETYLPSVDFIGGHGWSSIHHWQNFVDKDVRAMWKELSLEQKAAVFYMAAKQADDDYNQRSITG